MIKSAFAAALLALTVSAGSPSARAQTPTPTAAQPDSVAAFLRQLEPIIQRADVPAFLALVADSADRTRALTFSSFELPPGARRVVVQERDRAPLAGTLPGRGYRLALEVFGDHLNTARISTWRLDIARVGPGEGEWRIVDEDRITSVESLYRIALNPAKEFDAHDLTISAEDVDLTLAEGTVFVADVDLGVTAMVLMGRGEMHFHPAPASEKGQVKIFCGSETLKARFDAAYIRINPGDFNSLVDDAHLTLRPSADPRDFRRADEVFREESPRSFLLDLGDLSREQWTLMPASGDFLSEVRTRRFGTLTYVRSASEPEDITLFDRKNQHNISVYPSKEKIARRGSPFYDEDEQADYDILHYDIDMAYSPERQWIDARALVRFKVRAAALNTITMRLADSLIVRSIASDRLGRLFGLRVRNQNTVVINLPSTVMRGSEMTVAITYAGRLEPQPADREAIEVAQAPQPPRGLADDMPVVTPEPNLLYSNRNIWYPQGAASDYATATMRITVPATYDCVASGSLAPGAPELIPPKDAAPARKLYLFEARQPLRYLAFIVSRFTRAETATIGLNEPAPSGDGVTPLTGIVNHSLNLAVEANPRQVAHGRELAERAADIAQFYASIVGDSPYPSFTVALVESNLPGGHSPAYFAALNQPLPTSPFVWRNDPTAFTNFPEFFAAHEIAHQWWGQAVGWRNYHEQWLSEGFAQYFAAMYAQHLRGNEAFGAVLRQMRRWAIAEGDQGPVYLGYRLGHIRSESRVFRALVYDKGAAVLHMLRRLVGDDVFFRGLQRFYRDSRFKKVATEDLRLAMEAEAGRPLTRFFERWIYGSTIARVKFSYRVEGNEVVLHAEQTGEIFDVPLTVTLEYADKRTDVIFPVTDRSCDMRVALAGTLRGAEVSKDDGTLVEITRGT